MVSQVSHALALYHDTTRTFPRFSAKCVKATAEEYPGRQPNWPSNPHHKLTRTLIPVTKSATTFSPTGQAFTPPASHSFAASKVGQTSHAQRLPNGWLQKLSDSHAPSPCLPFFDPSPLAKPLSIKVCLGARFRCRGGQTFAPPPPLHHDQDGWRIVAVAPW